MAQQLYSTVDLSRLLGIPEHRITYAHRTGKLADASYCIAGKRVYSEGDLQRVAEYFGVSLKEGKAYEPDEGAVRK